jgi:hypothetical protein
MKKTRNTKPNHRPKKLKPTNPRSPWRKATTIPPAPIESQGEIILGGDEIEIPLGELEGPDEIPEGIEDFEPPEESDE